MKYVSNCILIPELLFKKQFYVKEAFEILTPIEITKPNNFID